MRTVLCGIGDIVTTGSSDETLTAMALGSCVAVVAYDPVSRVTGMAHIALPGNPRDRNRQQGEGYYADTAIPALFEQMGRRGASKAGLGLEIKLIGGASILGVMAGRDIGKRNVLGVKRVLWRHGLGPMAEEVGGSNSRTVKVQGGGGRVVVSTPGQASRDL